MGWVTFGSEKKFSEHINMGSSFEDLVATRPTVKTDYKSDEQFDLQNFLIFRILHLIPMTLVFCPLVFTVIFSRTHVAALAWFQIRF